MEKNFQTCSYFHHHGKRPLFKQQNGGTGVPCQEPESVLGEQPLCFCETWLKDCIPDSITNISGFRTICADRDTRTTGKQKGGGLAVFINYKWCNPGHTTIREQTCNKDIELLAVSSRRYYLSSIYPGSSLLWSPLLFLHSSICTRGNCLWCGAHYHRESTSETSRRIHFSVWWFF